MRSSSVLVLALVALVSGCDSGGEGETNQLGTSSAGGSGGAGQGGAAGASGGAAGKAGAGGGAAGVGGGKAGTGGAAAGGAAGASAGSGGTAGAGGSSAGAGGSAGGSAGEGGSAGGSAGGAGQGGAGGQAGASGAGAGGAGGSAELGCKGATPDQGGFEVCGSGLLHRKEALACPDERDGQPFLCEPDGGGPGGPGGPMTCKDADCEPGAFATCNKSCGGAGCVAFCGCEGSCLQDADCGSDAVCVCAGKTGQCVKAGCHGDADCAPGQACLEAYTKDTQACGSEEVRMFACTTPDDQCDDDADCGGPGKRCAFDGARRVCYKTPVPCCGANGCPNTCWDADDCGGKACLFAASAGCTGVSDGNPATVQKDGHCEAPGDLCKTDADCPAVGGSPQYCLYDKDHLRCGSLPVCLPP